MSMIEETFVNSNLKDLLISDWTNQSFEVGDSMDQQMHLSVIT
jgi:hypothetical protein